MPWKGRTLVLGIFGVALVMAVGGWWFRYEASRHAAAFWGAEGARVLSGESAVELLVLGDSDEQAADQSIAGRPVSDKFDLSEKRGLIHLRYALTQDADFDWDEVKSTPAPAGPEWRYAMRFSLDDDRLDVLFTEDFAKLGKLTDDGEQIDVLPCPRLAPSIEHYLSDVGAPIGKTKEPAPR